MHVLRKGKNVQINTQLSVKALPTTLAMMAVLLKLAFP